MSDELHFSNNYQDLCQQHGIDAGFQFEFYCQRCNDRWRTNSKPYRSGQASGWVQKGASLFGGLLGSAGSALDGLAQAGWHNARDDAFRDAVGDAKAHFNRCSDCHSYVCATCFDSANGLCHNCAPDVNVAIARSRVQGEVRGAAEKAEEAGQVKGAARAVDKPMQLVCPECKCETHGAKFCPECGHKMAQTVACTQCAAQLQPGTKFCGECGTRQAG
jgi:hypothetical protein